MTAPIVDEDRVHSLVYDGSGSPPSWEEGWVRETNDAERELAEELQDADVGTVLITVWLERKIERGDSDLDPEDTRLEVRHRRDRPGVARLTLESDMRVWVVRGQYVFVTSHDGETLLMGDWTGLDNPWADWRIEQ